MLPDLRAPDKETMRNLALYWDEIVWPAYENGINLDLRDPLVLEGVFRPLEREVPADKLFPSKEGLDLEKNWAYEAYRDSSGEIKVRLAPDDSPPKQPHRNLRDLSDLEVEGMAAIALGQHLGYVDDSLAIASSNNLAPISHSLGGHLAAVIGSSGQEQDATPAREAALLSVVIEALAIDPSVSPEELLLFRSRSSHARARFRGSLVDLAAKLRGDSSPASMLAEARDTYKNRVEPALGDLEEALNESQIKFWLKSLVGATAIAIAPIEPVSTSAGAARVMGQTIDYSYSKSKLVREHPYGYLHQVRQELGATHPGNESEEHVESTMMAPRESLWDLWHQYWIEARARDREVDSN